MRLPSPGTYSTFEDAVPSHISILLLAARALYAYPALQRLFPRYSALPYVACLAGGLHSPECLRALMALREATAGPAPSPHVRTPSSSAGPLFGGAAALTDAEVGANRKHAFDAGLTKALQVRASNGTLARAYTDVDDRTNPGIINRSWWRPPRTSLWPIRPRERARRYRQQQQRTSRRRKRAPRRPNSLQRRGLRRPAPHPAWRKPPTP